RTQLFETERNAAIPFEELYTHLRAMGLKPPNLEILFTMSSDWSKQLVGGLTITRRPHPVAELPWGFQVYIDQRSPENCRVEFDASRYRPDDISSFIAVYVSLLENAAEEPHLTIGALLEKTRGA